MSAVLESAPPAQTQKRLTPVEYVSRLTGDDQEAIFFYLVRELIRENGEYGWIPIATDTEHFGSFLPAKGERELFERRGPKLTEEERAELQRRMDNPDQCQWLTTEELLAELDAADPIPPPTPG